MTDILFISDLHLDEDQPEITRNLLAFLAREAPHAEALYVLGDLFEAWVGDDHETAFTREITAAFNAFSNNGKRALYFLHGNRDFMLGDVFAAAAGGKLIAENTIVDLHGTRALIAHGDALCTDDAEYQKFRTMVRNPEWLNGVRALPVEARLAMAAKLRGESKMRNANKASNIMDVNNDAVTALLKQTHADALIHGHTHRPAVHRVALGNREATRYVLGDWHANRGWCLRANKTGLHLESF